MLKVYDERQKIFKMWKIESDGTGIIRSRPRHSLAHVVGRVTRDKLSQTRWTDRQGKGKGY